MSLWDLRQYVESNIPLWVALSLLLIPGAGIIIVAVIEERRKRRPDTTTAEGEKK